MKKITLDEMKKIELEILIEFDSVCRRRGLRYSLCGGTLLGAIRHKGFIPWDDDIDVCMPREDYEKLKSESFSHLVFLNEETKDYGYCFGKLIDKRTKMKEHDMLHCPKDYGVYMDIFPLDEYSDQWDEEHLQTIQILKNQIYFSANKGVKMGKNILNWWKCFLVWWGCRNKSIETLRNEFAELLSNQPQPCNFYISAGGTMGRREIIPKSLVEGKTEVEFEGHLFYAVEKYHDYLKHFYGDYMQLPPIEKRKTHHRYKAFYRY